MVKTIVKSTCRQCFVQGLRNQATEINCGIFLCENDVSLGK